MDSIVRLAALVSCPSCGASNRVLLPEPSCGNEFIWHARCGGCGDWRWFHSRADRAFVDAIRGTAARRGEPGGLSEEGTREAHGAFEATVDACDCGGRFHVVRDLREESCTACGTSLGKLEFTAPPAEKIDVAPLRMK